MQVSFYVLSEQYLKTLCLHQQPLNTATAQINTQNTASHLDAVLGFVCKLCQTILQKAARPLLIIDDNDSRLNQLDQRLWSSQATSFIPHHLISVSPPESMTALIVASPVLLSHHQHYHHIVDILNCQSTAPNAFCQTAVVLNLASQPLAATNHQPSRLLEIITPDESSLQQGRDRYRYYRQQGCELTHFKL